MNNFILNIKKDMKLIFSIKFFILIFSPLILYSLYINFVYVKQDVQPISIYRLSEDTPNFTDYNSDIKEVNNKKAFHKIIKENNDSVGIESENDYLKLSFYSSGDEVNDEMTKRLSLAKLYSSASGYYETIGKYTREEKLRREMTCEVLFFEIVAVVFIGATSVLFKEKQMGIFKIYRVLPESFNKFILSKIIIFIAINLLISSFLILFNIGFEYVLTILSEVWIDIVIISVITILLSYICSFLFKDFKQFGLFYAFIMIFMTSPVFLVANTPVKWNWIEKYPVYISYMSLKNNFFGEKSYDLTYLIISIIIITSFIVLTNYLAKKKLGEG